LIQHVDINECTLGVDNCAYNATCSDTEGSYECTCDPGYTGDGFNCTSKVNRVLIIGLCEEQYDYVKQY